MKDYIKRLKASLCSPVKALCKLGRKFISDLIHMKFRTTVCPDVPEGGIIFENTQQTKSQQIFVFVTTETDLRE